MSNMLEQAIADAAALREQAIKNAEQSVIEKYSHQIKEAVEQMLEADEDPMSKVDEVINEAEEELNEEAEAPIAGMGAEPQGSTIEAPASWDSRYDDMMTNFSALVDNLPADENGMIELDLGDFELSQAEEEALGDDDTEDMPIGEPSAGLEDSGDASEGEDTLAEPEAGGDDLDDLLGALQEGEDKDEDEQLQEILNMLEEELHMEDGGEVRPTGAFDVGSPNQKRAAEAREAYEAQHEGEEEDSEEESEEDKTTELYETIEILTKQNEQMVSVLEKLEIHLEETLLSNAKLLYQNRTLGDASLNERQKSKIVEAIANAESPKEAKRLHETLKATVGSTPSQKKGPQSLSESVNRRSNLSSMLNSRQNINESKTADNPFMEKMQKLAGIKK